MEKISSAKARSRWVLGVALLALPVLLLAGLCVVAAPVTSAAGPTEVSGPIDVPTTWDLAGSPYIVTGTVTILDTGSLTIQPGVEVRFAWDTALIAEGPLMAMGAPGDRIIFTSNLAPPEPVSWDGIQLLGGGNTLQHCLVEYGYYGLFIALTSDGNLVADSEFSLNGHWVGPVGGSIVGSTDNSQFLRNQIYNSPFGIRLAESSYNVIDDNDIAFIDDVGIGLQGTAGTPDTGNVVTNNGLGHLLGEGLSFLYQSDLTVSGNHVYQAANGGSGGPKAPRRVATVGATVDDWLNLPVAAGLSLRGCDGATVTGNSVTECGWGDDPAYRAGVFISDTTGLAFENNMSHLNRGDGLEYAAANGDAPFIQNNGFWDNEDLELESLYPAAIDVRGNWWGTDAPTPGVHLDGALLYDPWVTLDLLAMPTILPPDGTSQSDLTVTMLDGAGHHAPDGLSIALASSMGDLLPTNVSMSSGLASASLTAPLTPGTAWLTATAPLPPPAMTTTIPPGRQAFAWVQFVLTGTQTLTLTADPPSIPADGASTSTLTAEVRDGQGDPVDDGTVVVFDTTRGTFPGGLTTTPSPTGTLTVEAESGSVTKTGTWVSYTDPQASGGAGVFSGNAGDRVSYSFTGTAVSVLFQMQYNTGIAQVYVDGELEREIDTYDPGVQYQQEELIASDLPYATHDVEVVVTGVPHPGITDAYVVVDAIRVYGNVQNGAYLTSGGVSIVTLTSEPMPSTAVVTACSGASCDSASVRFRAPWGGFVYLPIVQRNYPWSPPQPPGCYPVMWQTTAVGPAPHGVAVNHVANCLYVANHAGDSLSIVDAGTYALLNTVGVGDGPGGVAYNPGSGLIYVANRNDNSVTVLQASDNTAVATIPVGAQPNGIAVDEGYNRVYVANYGAGTVSVIDGASNTVIDTLSVGAEPAMVAVNPFTHRAYVTLHGAGRLAIIDSAGQLSLPELHSSGPYGVAVDAVRDLVYVATIDDFRIVVLNGNGGFLGWAEIRRLPGGEPVPLRTIAVNPLAETSGHIFVTTAGSDGGWNKFLLLPKGWPEYFARAHALDLNEPREGIAFEPISRRVFVTSRGDSLVATILDGEPTCPNNFSAFDLYQITVCVGNPDGSCRDSFTR